MGPDREGNRTMVTRCLGILRHGATSRIGATRHLPNHPTPLRAEAGRQLFDACHESHDARRWVSLPPLEE
jgi:hypothetical protein